jgi:hypothetical protein
MCVMSALFGVVLFGGPYIKGVLICGQLLLTILPFYWKVSCLPVSFGA